MQDFSTGSKSPDRDDKIGVNQNPSSCSNQTPEPQHGDVKTNENIQHQCDNNSARHANESAESVEHVSSQTCLEVQSDSHSPKSCMQSSSTILNGPVPVSKRAVWGRTAVSLSFLNS